MLKRLLSIVVFLFVYSFLNAQTVYIAETGKKFHKKKCSSSQTGKSGIQLKEAKKRGYSACKVCNPEVVEEKKKSANTKK
jgi:hypothetical protein